MCTKSTDKGGPQSGHQGIGKEGDFSGERELVRGIQESDNLLEKI